MDSPYGIGKKVPEIIHPPRWATFVGNPRKNEQWRFHWRIAGAKTRLLNTEYWEGALFEIVDNNMVSVLYLPTGLPKPDKQQLLKPFSDKQRRGWQSA